jgi:nifR3 family TIM-barrel protein
MLRIGSLQLESCLLLAPIARYCDLAFRRVIRPLGGMGLAYTDLINPRGILEQTPKTLELLHTEPADTPLTIQLYGNRCREMADAARWCQDYGASVIDINMGCPVPKVCRRGGGARMLQDPDQATRVVEAVASAVSIPTTVKMRLGWDRQHIVAPQLAKQVENAGAAAVAVHARTTDEQFAGEIDLDDIAAVVASVDQIPVIGNGNVATPEDARRMLDRTGCHGVMIGRVALRDPWIFQQTHTYLTTGECPAPPSQCQRLEFIHQHFRNLIEFKGERLACAIMRQRFSWYLGKLTGPPDARQRVRAITSQAQYWDTVRIFEDRHPDLSSTEICN